MSANSSIQWTEATWNPVRGCAKDGVECDNCYAMAIAHRFSGADKPYEGLTRVIGGRGQWNGQGRFVTSMLAEPFGWRAPRRIFVNSMSDLFFEAFTDEQIADVFGVMAVAGQRFQGAGDGHTKQVVGDSTYRWPRMRSGPHSFQVLTKRAARMAALTNSLSFRKLVADAAYRHAHDRTDAGARANEIERGAGWPLPNVWLGVSTGTTKSRDEKIPALRQVQAAVRFLSIEPLLEDIGALDLTGIHWVIVGGESGPRARPCAMEWISSVVGQCAVDKVPCFVKQLGAKPFLDGIEVVPLFDRKGGDTAEWPRVLRVRQFPVTA